MPMLEHVDRERGRLIIQHAEQVPGHCSQCTQNRWQVLGYTNPQRAALYATPYLCFHATSVLGTTPSHFAAWACLGNARSASSRST